MMPNPPGLILDLVAAGRGFTVLPLLAVREAAEAKGLIVVALAATVIPVRWQAVVTPHSDRLDDATTLLRAVEDRYRTENRQQRR